MKTYKYILMCLASLLVIGTNLMLTACSEDDGGGQPVIERVRLTDPEKSDSAFTVGSLGQMILIEGHNLGNALNIYINNQDCYFNANYNTDTHIILTIPADLIVYGADNSLPMEIRVETTHGTAVYGFHVIEVDINLAADIDGRQVR